MVGGAGRYVVENAMFDLLKNRPFIAQMIGLAFALLAAIGVALPDRFTPESVIGVAMLIVGAVTIVLRYRHGGTPEGDGKLWWQSRTIWVSVLSALFGVLALAGVKLPAGFDQDATLNLVMVVLTVLGAVFGAKAKGAIG